MKHLGKRAAYAVAALGLVSLLSGILTVIRAPSILFLKLKVVATEYGYVLAAAFALSVPLIRLARLSRPTRAAWGACLAAGITLTTLPVFRATAFAGDLSYRLERAFGSSTNRSPRNEHPFCFRGLARLWPESRAGAERVVFASHPEYTLAFDLCRPPRWPSGGAPCVIVVHGGKWTEGNSEDFAALNPRLARLGYVVVGINYRKADQYPFPAARDDLRSAVEYVKENAETLGVDSEKIVLLGRSAGGQLALLVAYEERDPAIKGVVSFYAPTDMRFGYRDATNPWIIDNEASLELYLGGVPDAIGTTYDDASPISFVSADCPPTLLLHGAHDELVHVAQSDCLASRLQEVGAPHLYLRLPWATHGFDHNLAGPGGQISTYAVCRFLEKVFEE
jgi:acetyl esterase/lipase